MKNITILAFLLFAIASKAQSPIIDINESAMGQPDGYYIKDINNLLNPFEGTYVYTNGGTTFKVILVKKIQQYNGRYYEDLIIGEYQFTQNYVEKVNTLAEINVIYNNQRIHKINGNDIVNNNFRMLKCPSCSPNEKRFHCSIKDPSTNRFARMTMRRVTEGTQELMIINISHPSRGNNDPSEPEFSLPLEEFTLVKE